MTFNKTWENDKDYFWDKHSARLGEMDENATDPLIEILPTYTDENGIVWQLPHDSGWARICFDACMSGHTMISRIRQVDSLVMKSGVLVPSAWQYLKIEVAITIGGEWQITIDGAVSYYPPSETHRVFVMAVGLRYDFGGVVLC